MKIKRILRKNRKLCSQLLHIWENSVRATHSFLSETEINGIKKYVPNALKQIPCLVIAEDENKTPIAFMGISGQKLEMLFVLSAERKKGVGKALIQYAVKTRSINEVTVNEQNPSAIGFYEHMGFRTYKRTDFDEQGNPYPLLYMKRF